jgi:hypothetical protein
MQAKKWFGALMAAVAISGISVPVANAATEDKTDRYDISADIPAAQIDKNNTAEMDIKLEPGQSNDLTYYIQNKTKKAITFDVSAGSATTTNLGQLDYTSMNDNLANKSGFQIGSYIKLDQSKVTVQPESTATVKATVSLPSSAHLTGQVAGGVAFHEKGTAASTTSQVALMVRSSDDLPALKFSTSSAKVIVKNRLVKVRLTNEAARRAMSTKVTSKVYSEDTGKVVYKKTSTVDMAPRSAFDFRIKTKVHDLPAGDYTVKTTVKVDNYSKTFTNSMTVTKTQAQELSTQKAGMGVWDWIKIVLLAIVLFLIAFFAVRYIGSNKKN